MATKDIHQIDVTDRNVLMRVDFNVPLDGEARITDDTRIRAALPTIEALLERGAKIVLMSHLGRPKGKVVPAMSLSPVADRLAELVSAPVKFATDTIGEDARDKAAALQKGEILLLENLRFASAETDNDSEFAAALAKLGDVYVNDAFGTAHRAHASTVGVTEFFPQRCAGLLMAKELKNLGALIDEPGRPFVAVLGGAKVKGKVEIIEYLLDTVDVLLLGGGMIFTFMRAQGIDVGASLVDEETLATAESIIKAAREKKATLILPEDVVIADAFSNDAARREVMITDIPEGWMGLDIGSKTTERFAAELAAARSVFWNGPMGVFEMPNFAHGTEAVAKAIADATAGGAHSVVGGGDSVAAVNKSGLADAMSHVSTGGGASLEFMAGRVLPGVQALEGA